MARKPNAAQESALEDKSQGKDGESVVKDLPPANPLGEPVHEVDAYPNISEPGKLATMGGVETEETAGKPKAVPGETIVEHPLSPTDANPNPHGQRDEPFTAVAVKGEDGKVEISSSAEGGVEIEGLSDEPIHLGDGRTLAKGSKANVSKDVAKVLRDNDQAK